MVVQGSERRAMNTLVLDALTESNSCSKSSYTAWTKYMAVSTLSVMGFGSLLVKARITPLIRIISSLSIDTNRTTTIKVFFVFSIFFLFVSLLSVLLTNSIFVA